VPALAEFRRHFVVSPPPSRRRRNRQNLLAWIGLHTPARYAHRADGVENREYIAESLIRAGRDASQPVAFVESGSTPRERVVESTLGAVAAGSVEVNSPAVFVIGEVTRLRSRLKPAARSAQESLSAC